MTQVPVYVLNALKVYSFYLGRSNIKPVCVLPNVLLVPNIFKKYESCKCKYICRYDNNPKKCNIYYDKKM